MDPMGYGSSGSSQCSCRSKFDPLSAGEVWIYDLFISWPHRGNFTWGDGKSTVNIPAWIALCLAAFCLTESAPVCFPSGSKILFDSLFDGWDVWPGAIAAFPRSAIPRWFRFGGATFHRLAGWRIEGWSRPFIFLGRWHVSPKSTKLYQVILTMNGPFFQEDDDHLPEFCFRLPLQVAGKGYI